MTRTTHHLARCFLNTIAAAFPVLSAADKAGLVKPPDGPDGLFQFAFKMRLIS